MPADEIPRLFTLVPGSPNPAPGAEPIADGVQWPDGSVTVHWRDPDRLPQLEQWVGFDPQLLEDERLTVVWRLQTTYADPPAADQ